MAGTPGEITAILSRAGNVSSVGGLSLEETAEALQISPTTVVRDRRFARAWLRRELTQGDEGSGALAAD